MTGYVGGYGSGGGGQPTLARTEQFNGTLPGAGAFTTQAYTPIPAGTTKVAYWITYTRGAAGGNPIFQPEWENGKESAARELILEPNSLVVSAPNARVAAHLEHLLGPIPADTSSIVYEMEFFVPAGATGGRLLAAEFVQKGKPGTVIIAIAGVS